MSADLALDLIRADTQAQPRASMLMDTIENYIERMSEGDEFPPLVVFFDGSVYWLGDGFHRYHAAKGLGLATFPCDVREGGLREAILHSVGANAAHGLQRSNEDKRRSVMKLLDDPEWSQWPQTKIAKLCSVSQQYVSKLAQQNPAASYNSGKMRTVERGGQTYTQNTGNIGGAARPRQEPAWKPSDIEHDRPVFDNTPSGQAARLESMGASPERAAKLAQEIADAWIATALTKVEEEMKRLPDPADAARRYPDGQRYLFTAERLHRMGAWMTAFAREWQRIEGGKNVAAE